MTELRARVTAALTAEPVAAVPAAQAPAALAPARWVLPAPWQVDTALTVAALGVAIALAATRRWPGDALLAIAIVLPFAWLRRRPLSAAVVSLAATVAYSAVARPADPLAGLPPVSVLIVVPLLAGAVCTLPQAISVLLACLAAAALAVVTDPPPDFASASVPAAAALALACWAAGRALRDGSRLLSALAETAAQVQDEDAAAAQQAVAEERLRIARELHDAVGHALTTVVMQATAARRVWDSDPALAGGHVTTLRMTVAQTVSELHGFVLSAVVGGGDVSAGLAGIPELVTRASACGLPVHLQATGTERRIPPAVGQTAYRIVQEAVTNAARHAPGAAVQVTVAWDAAGLRLEIINDQPAWPPGPAGPAPGQAEPAPGRAGHGLLGMRERAAGCGGTVAAGPRPGGGFTVRAQLPCLGLAAAGDAG
jgi:signal transduction histidine kinase